MKKFTRLLALLLVMVTVVGMVAVMAPKANAAMSISDYQTKMKEFINDSRWKHNTGWGYYQKPKYASYSAIGCCAYAADFAGYVYGQKKTAWTSTVFTSYTSVDKIQSGDILQISGHWLVVLERNGNALYTAEGNWRDKKDEDAFRYCRITNNGWKIQNGKLYNILGKSYSSLVKGYHYKFSDDGSSSDTSNLCYFTALSSKMSVSDTDAVIALKLNKPSGLSVSQYGANIYDASGKKLASVSDKSSGYPNSTYVDMWWTVGKSMGIKLSPGTKYQFDFWATVNGKTYTSQKQSFTTTGKATQVTSVSLSPTSKTLKTGETVTLSATVAPSNAANKALTWTTSNSNVATVTDAGVVTAKAPGTAVITATAKDGSGKAGTATITVECSHTLVCINGKTPTCTETGLTQGTACTSCGQVLVPSETIPATGHTWKNATCTTPKTCSVCGAKEGTAAGHTWKNATCTTPKTCSVCGAKEGTAAGHSWKNATCTTPKTCSVCGATDGKKAAHTYDNIVDGTCNVCGVHRENVESRKVVHMFRMFNPNTGEHFYTGSTVERDNLIAAGWHYEGIGFTFPANSGAPVHRLFQPTTGEHLYTMDEGEKARLISQGWNYEGIAFNSAYNTEAVQHRLHNPNATVGAYHFTFSIEERDNLIAAGWEYQGIGWYSCWK